MPTKRCTAEGALPNVTGLSEEIRRDGDDIPNHFYCFGAIYFCVMHVHFDSWCTENAHL